MINNNPYIVPERPLKQSKVTMQPAPLLPHQINRRQQEKQHKYHTQMLKRSSIPYYIDTSVKEVTRIPLSPQTIIKGQPLQVSTVTPWQSSRELPNSLHFRELSQRINAITERLDSQERRLMMVMETKRHEPSTTLSDSTAHSYEPSTLFTSKQMEKYSQLDNNGQNGTEIVQKLREEVNGFKFERQKYEINLKEYINLQIKEQRNTITQELLDNFRLSLKEKFDIEEKKINECIQEMVRIQDNKIQNYVFQLKKEISNQVYYLRQEFKSLENRDKSAIFNVELKERCDRLNATVSELRSEYIGFKDHVFNSILTTHHHQQQMAKIKEKIQTLMNLLEKKQISLYQGHLNTSTEKSHHEIIRINFESFLTATNRYQSIKSKTNDFTYYIDTQGFLLDIQGYYILNSKNVKIKIEESEIRKLREIGILQ